MNIEELTVILNQLPDAKERRRYALLQAAAVLYAALVDEHVYPPDISHIDEEHNKRLPVLDDGSLEEVVTAAEALLEEIEERENEGSAS